MRTSLLQLGAVLNTSTKLETDPALWDLPQASLIGGVNMFVMFILCNISYLLAM